MPLTHPVMTVIDATLMRVPDDAVTIEVRLSWPHYRALLAIKALDTDARQINGWGSGYSKRPLKLYRGHDLVFIQHRSHVYVAMPDGSVCTMPISDMGDT